MDKEEFCMSSDKEDVGDDQKLNQENAVDTWTKEDKFVFLGALREHGTLNPEIIASVMKTKTKKEVEEAIEFYRNRGASDVHFSRKKKVKNDTKSFNSAALSAWASYLAENLKTDELFTETLEAIRIISTQEAFLPAKCTSGIDFHRIYKVIGDAIEGKPLEKDSRTVEVLSKCLVETIMTGKAFMRNSSVSRIVSGIKDEEMEPILHPSDTPELSLLRHFLSQRKYNPFDITEENLKLNKL